MTPGPLLQTRSRATGWSIAAALAVVAILLYEIRYALLPFVFAIAIAFVAEPLVVKLRPFAGGRRWVAALLIYLAVLPAIAAGFYWIGSMAAGDLIQFAQRAPQIAHDLILQIVGSDKFTIFGHTYNADQIVAELGRAASASLGIAAAVHAAEAGVMALFAAFLMLVLIPYLMISGPRLAAGAIWLIPPERRLSVEQLLPRILPTLRRYLVGVFLVVVYTALAGWIGFGPIFGLPHAALLAIAVGVLELIPAIGPISSATLVSLVAFQQKSISSIVLLIGFVIMLRLTIDNLVGPFVLGQAARIHPVVVIFAFVCGAMLFGAIGLLLAVPVAVCIKMTLQHYYAEPIREAEPG